MSILDPKPPTRAELTATYLPGDATGATDGQVATWDAAAGKFKPKPGGGGGGAVSSVVGQTGAVTGSQILADATVTAALAAKAPTASPTFTGTVGGVTKAMVGLGNADNTSDANKPVSTAAAAALAGKLDTIQDLYGNFGYASVHPVTTTINAAITAANALNVFPGLYDAHPGRRRLILVPPGTYNETTLTLSPYLDLISTTLNPADVIINGTGNTDGIKVNGSNLIAGVTVNNTGSAFGIHPVWNGFDQTVVLHKVNVVSTGTGGSLAGQILGGQSFYARDCNFTAANQYAVYFHNILPVAGRESSVVFDQCTATCTASGAPAVTINDENSDPVSFVWNGKLGSMSAPSGTDLQLVLLAGTGTIRAQVSAGAYTTISNGIGAAFLTAWPNLPAPKPRYPQPDVYGGDSRGTITPLLPMVTDSAASTVTALRQYFWPVRVTSICKFKDLTVGISGTVAGNYNVLLYQDSAGKPGTQIHASGSQVAAAGKNTWSGNGRVIYPGTYWLAVVFDSATVTPVCSSNAPLVQQMYYQDVAALTTSPNPATPVALTAGPVPIVTGRTT